MTQQSNGKSEKSGRFITFEGGEGVGKSTQVRHLQATLEQAGHTVLATREPGGSPGAEILRHVLLSGAAQPYGPETEAMLFAAARLDHLRATILPALERGAWVLCDRFADSTRVYQGIGGKVSREYLDALERITVDGHQPDLTLVLDLPAKAGLARVAARGAATDRFEAESLAVHDRLAAGFRDLPQQFPQRCVLIDASGEVDDVASRIRAVVAQRCGLTLQAAEH